MSETARPTRLVGGIVAYRDGDRVGAAIRSLLAQELPEGAHWAKIWVVISPDGLGTLAAARRVESEDSRVEVLEEEHRRGKSAALAEILRRAEGDLLVLLNGDALAEPGAVNALLLSTRDAPRVFGIMARPIPPPGDGRILATALGLLWGLHDRFHAELARQGRAGHLSDELFALPISSLPPFRPGIITDGAFAAAWIRSQGGELRYARTARVRLSLPARFRDHIEQRRRIHVGHWDVAFESGVEPTTLAAMFRSDPALVIRLIREELPAHPHPVRSFLTLLVAEMLSVALARWDIARRRKGYAVWPRVNLAEVEPRPETPASGATG
jgi:glycosyltransferase involved in cell wall biosynthesis